MTNMKDRLKTVARIAGFVPDAECIFVLNRLDADNTQAQEARDTIERLAPDDKTAGAILRVCYEANYIGRLLPEMLSDASQEKENARAIFEAINLIQDYITDDANRPHYAYPEHRGQILTREEWFAIFNAMNTLTSKVSARSFLATAVPIWIASGRKKKKSSPKKSGLIRIASDDRTIEQNPAHSTAIRHIGVMIKKFTGADHLREVGILAEIALDLPAGSIGASRVSKALKSTKPKNSEQKAE